MKYNKISSTGTKVEITVTDITDVDDPNFGKQEVTFFTPKDCKTVGRYGTKEMVNKMLESMVDA